MNTRLIQKILVATDGSDQSIRAAEYAAEIASCLKSEVAIVYALEESGVTQFVGYSIQADQELPGGKRLTGEEILADTKKAFLETDVPVHSKIIEGFAADVIIQEARDGKYDLIVMGSSGAGAGVVRRVLFGLGSVAERVLAHAPCPVLVVRNT